MVSWGMFNRKNKSSNKDNTMSFEASQELPTTTALIELARNMQQQGIKSSTATIGSTALMLAIAEKTYNGMPVIVVADPSGNRLGKYKDSIAEAFSATVADVNAPKTGVHSGLQPTNLKVTALEQVQEIAEKEPAKIIARYDTASAAVSASQQGRGKVVGKHVNFFKAQEAQQEVAKESQAPNLKGPKGPSFGA